MGHIDFKPYLYINLPYSIVGFWSWQLQTSSEYVQYSITQLACATTQAQQSWEPNYTGYTPVFLDPSQLHLSHSRDFWASVNIVTSKEIHKTSVDDGDDDSDSVTDDDTVRARVPDNQGRARCCCC